MQNAAEKLGVGLEEIARLGEKIRSRGSTRQAKMGSAGLLSSKELVPQNSRHCRRRRGSLSVGDKVEIVH